MATLTDLAVRIAEDFNARLQVHSNLAAGTDANALTATGIYPILAVPTDWQAQHFPTSARGHFTVTQLNSTSIQQEFTTWALNRPRKYVRAHSSGGSWGAWFEISPDPATSTAHGVEVDLDTITSVGLHEFAGFPTDWQAQHYPAENVRGTAHVLPVGPITIQVFHELAGPRIWTRDNYGGWRTWTEVGASTPSPGPVGPASPAQIISPGSTRLVPCDLTLGFGGSTLPASGAARLCFQWGAPVHRWRLRIRDVDIRSGAPGPDATLSAVKIGTHTGSGALTGVTELALTQSVAGGATDAVTAWSTIPLDPLVEYAVEYTWAAAGVVQANLGTTYLLDGGTWASQGNAPFHVVMECETWADIPVALVTGDSNSAGVGTSRGVIESWPHQWARAAGALVTHVASSGGTLLTAAEPDGYMWTRLDGRGYTVPDVIMQGLGQNDLARGDSILDLTARLGSVLEIIRSRWAAPIHLALPIPRSTDPLPDFEDRRHDWNTYQRTEPLEVRGLLDWPAAVSDDDLTLRPEYAAADGIHLNTAGAAAVAASIPALVRAAA